MDSDDPAGSPLSTEAECWKACCEENDLLPEDEDDGSWSDFNGAWMLIEVFPVDDFPGAVLPNGEFAQYNPFDKPAYCSLAECFDDEVLKLAAS